VAAKLLPLTVTVTCPVAAALTGWSRLGTAASNVNSE
jgi:hypothetical protein